MATFFDLPAELRNYIYHLSIDWKKLRRGYVDLRRHRPGHPGTSLPYVNRQIRFEALGVYYHHPEDRPLQFTSFGTWNYAFRSRLATLKQWLDIFGDEAVPRSRILYFEAWPSNTCQIRFGSRIAQLPPTSVNEGARGGRYRKWEGDGKAFEIWVRESDICEALGRLRIAGAQHGPSPEIDQLRSKLGRIERRLLRRVFGLVEEAIRGRPKAYLEAADVRDLLDVLSRTFIVHGERCLLTAARELSQDK